MTNKTPDPKRRKVRDPGPPMVGERQGVDPLHDDAHVATANAQGGFTKETFWNLRPAGVPETRGFVEVIKALEGKR